MDWPTGIMTFTRDNSPPSFYFPPFPSIKLPFLTLKSLLNYFNSKEYMDEEKNKNILFYLPNGPYYCLGGWGDGSLSFLLNPDYSKSLDSKHIPPTYKGGQIRK